MEKALLDGENDKAALEQNVDDRKDELQEKIDELNKLNEQFKDLDHEFHLKEEESESL